MKMIGTCAERARLRISDAVSSPSIPGMLTSRRITAKSCSRTDLSACCPDSAMKILGPRSSRIVWYTSRLSERSSTMRISTCDSSTGQTEASPSGGAGLCDIGAKPSRSPRATLPQPRPQHTDHQLGVDRLGKVIPRASFHALLPVALHRLGRDGDDRNVL